MMMICLFALGFIAFAVVNALAVVGAADRLSRVVKTEAPAPGKADGLIVTKLAA